MVEIQKTPCERTVRGGADSGFLEGCCSASLQQTLKGFAPIDFLSADKTINIVWLPFCFVAREFRVVVVAEQLYPQATPRLP